MKAHLIDKIQRLPITLEEAWDFFSSPKNLAEITPDHLGFKILSGADTDMYPGQIIEYTVKPILGIPMYWMTEIKNVAYQSFFIDEQRYGPYTLWHHKHFFKEIEGGVEMRDIVHYKIPLGLLGRIVNWLFVQRQLQQIFNYRFQILEKKFGIYTPYELDKVK